MKSAQVGLVERPGTRMTRQLLQIEPAGQGKSLRRFVLDLLDFLSFLAASVSLW
jgi:hypothetical protein